MKKTVLFFFTVIICYVYARLFSAHKGYVLIKWGHYTLESSLWSFLFALLIIVLVVMLCVSLWRLIFNGVSLFYPVTRNSKSKKALGQATKGMIHYANGHWGSAQRLLADAAAAGQAPLITYLAAARAAHQNSDDEGCANYLRKADKVAPGADLAIGITRAELLLNSGYKEQALATLRRLYKKSPKHTYVLKLLKQSYLELKDWDELARLLPNLRKRKVVSTREYEKLQHMIYRALFEQACHAGKTLNGVASRIQPVNSVWKLLSSQHKKDIFFIKEYAYAITSLGAEKQAETFIRQQLQNHYSQSLIRLYGSLSTCDQQKLLLTAESLLNEHPNDSELLLCLGKICQRCQLTGKAEEYFKHCLEVSPSVEAYKLAGQFYAQRGLYKQSTKHFLQASNFAKNVDETQYY